MDVARDAVMFQEGDAARVCYRIVSGAVRLCKGMADGRRYVVDFLLPGDLIGLDMGGTYTFTAEAITACVLVRYDRAQMQAALDDDPAAGRRLLDLTMQHLAAAHGQLLMLGRMTAAERVASFVLNLRRRLASHQAGPDVVPLAMTRADIADHLGLTLETVSRVLNQLKRRGVIDLPHAQEIRVRNRRALEALAGNPAH
jgi:CRP-like cAMP-binding protein